MQEKFLIGGYTKKESKGIYEVTLDVEKKELGKAKLYATVNNPTYFAQDDEQHLFSVAIVDGLGGIASFAMQTDQADSINAVVKEGSPICYVGVDKKRGLVFGANYHLGEISVYKQDSGQLVLVDTVKHSGSGPHPNQDQARVHFTDLTPDGRLVACDLGNDGVYTYDIDESGKLKEVAVFYATSGAGSRHIVFHPNGAQAYLFCELSSTIEVLDYSTTEGTFSRVQVISTLPEDFHAFNGGAAIRISSDGKFLYASNRGHDSIAIFSVTENGKKIDLLNFVSTEGNTPRDFNFSQTEDFLLVANQDSDNVTLFERNQTTGDLTLLQKDVWVPEGTCVMQLV